MEKNVLVILLIFLTNGIFAQLGIGTTSPNENAILELSSSTQGIKFPRLTTLQRTGIVLPAKGLTVFDTEINCLMTNFGTASVPSWKCLGGLPFKVPSAPTNLIPKALYGEASIAFTTPVSDGGSPIINYTVTASPGGFTTTGDTSPLVVSRLTNGTSYTFTVYATNAVGDSQESSPSVAVVPNCGVFITGVYKTFACHNLDADTSLDPNVPAEGLHGNYYQWGKKIAVATPYDIIGSWSATSATNGSWLDANKTDNDPCPTGFRVPTASQWYGVGRSSLNIMTFTGTWVDDGNFTTAVHFGPSTSVITLTLPAGGLRAAGDGLLLERGMYVNYWSSSEHNTGARWLSFDNNSESFATGYAGRAFGGSVRCISE